MKSFIKILFTAIILCSITQFSNAENITVKVKGKGGTTIVYTPDGGVTASICPEQSNDDCATVEIPESAIQDGQISPNTNITVTTNDGTVFTGSFIGCVNGNSTNLNGLVLTIQ